jgi:hypothetical protein
LRSSTGNRLTQALEDGSITKVFHDFSEDAAALFRHAGLELRKVFDTQIAHKLERGSILRKSISLSSLLSERLGVNCEEKDAAKDLMRADPGFWERRPLTKLQLKYAAADVHHLIPLYKSFSNKEETLKLTEQMRCYPSINEDVRIEKGRFMTGLVKAASHNRIFLALNRAGKSGIVSCEQSVSYLTRFLSESPSPFVNLEVVSDDSTSVSLKVPDFYLRGGSRPVHHRRVHTEPAPAPCAEKPDCEVKEEAAPKVGDSPPPSRAAAKKRARQRARMVKPNKRKVRGQRMVVSGLKSKNYKQRS